MNDRSFVDTNVLVYLFSDEPDKQQRANALLISAPPEETLVISTQVIGEFVNVCLRRGLLSETETAALIDVFASALEVARPEIETLREGMRLRERYGYAWWDSVLLATALEAGCSVFYSEDLHDGQVLEGGLRIENPFR